MRRVGTWAAFWVVLFPLWLLYEGEWDASEVIAGSAAAAIGATAATIAAERALPRYRLERLMLRRAARVPWQVVREFGAVTWFLVRHPRGRGRFRAVPFSAGRNDPAGRARRALTAILVTYSPNSYVVDIDADSNVMLVHGLTGQPAEQVTLE